MGRLETMFPRRQTVRHRICRTSSRTSFCLFITMPVPDFSDWRFAPREANADWSAIVHQGGPARGFSRVMPAFGDAAVFSRRGSGARQMLPAP